VPRRPSVLLAALAVLALQGGVALAVDNATDLCPAIADPCYVNSLQLVSPGSVLDFGTRALELGPNGRLDVGAGAMTIQAGKLLLHNGSRLLGSGGMIAVTVTGTIEIENQSRIDVSADQPGWVSLTAVGATINGLVTARATGALDGGNVDLRALDLTIGGTGRVVTTGGVTGLGGLITVAADRTLTMDGALDASGGDSGGAIEVDAGLVSSSGMFDVSGGAGGSGALLEIDSKGSVTLGVVRGSAAGSDTLGGSGADVSVIAGDLIELNGSITLNGGGLGGQGGTLTVNAGADLVQRGAIAASGPGAEGFGGEVTLGAIGAITLAAIDAGGLRRGGHIQGDTNATLMVTARLDADGTGEGSEAGSIGLHGCDLQVTNTGIVSSAGPGGVNLLQASGAMTIQGSLVAGDENDLEYRETGATPTLTGTFTPLATTTQNLALAPCGFTATTLPPGPTTTTLPGQNCAAVFAGYDLVLCRLAAMNDLIAHSSVTALGGKKTATKLGKKLARLGLLVDRARTAKKPTKKLKAAEKQIASIVRIIQKSLKKQKFDADLAATLVDLAGGAKSETKALRTGQR
jgi:hypothetical protein